MLPTHSFIESEWWALKQIWDKGACYTRALKVVPYCLRCGTPLSSHEVAQGYKDVKKRSAVVTFQGKKVKMLIFWHGPQPHGPFKQPGTLRKPK